MILKAIMSFYFHSGLRWSVVYKPNRTRSSSWLYGNKEWKSSRGAHIIVLVCVFNVKTLQLKSFVACVEAGIQHSVTCYQDRCAAQSIFTSAVHSKQRRAARMLRHLCVFWSCSFSLAQAHCHAGIQVTDPVVTQMPDGCSYLARRWLMTGVGNGGACVLKADECVTPKRRRGKKDTTLTVGLVSRVHWPWLWATLESLSITRTAVLTWQISCYMNSMTITPE